MIVRAALVLLALLVVVAALGRWRRIASRPGPPPIESARRCPDCEAYVFGPRPEPCARPDCRFRTA
jgi:hypothetical protein